MNTDTILDLLDNSSRIRAFNSCLEKLEDAPQLDLEALRVCIKLRPAQPTAAGAGYQGKDTPSHVESAVPPDQDIIALNERLHGLLVARIPQETLDSDHFYNLARILCSNGPFADAFFRGNIYQGLLALLPELSRHTDATDELEGSVTRDVRRAKSYLTLLKCSYWLPSNCYHVVDSSSLGLLSQFMGIEVTDDIAQDAISALLSLLRRGEPIVVAAPSVARQSWLNLDAISGQAVLSTSIIDDCLWEQLSALEHKNQTGGKRSSKIFRTWFQWMFQAANDKVQLRCLHDSSYWEIIRQGLLSGYADQRKYCIGIIRHSLLAAQSDICTPVMDFRVAERAVYLKAYEQYSALFETIVLDRYANQVQACLPELTKLLQTVVTPPMVSTLLSAALSPMVQDGVRKLVGNWYIEHVITFQGNINGHLQFLLHGFLPWATIGELFTTSVVATRDTTTSVHGTSLAHVIARFVQAYTETTRSPSVETPDDAKVTTLESNRRAVIVGVLDFILDAGGKIFQFSILYLLEGLVTGLRMCSVEPALQAPLTEAEIDKLSRVSRLPGLPEIAGDLYTEYCTQICDLANPGWKENDTLAYQQLRLEAERLRAPLEVKTEDPAASMEPTEAGRLGISTLREELQSSKHSCIQGNNFGPKCKGLFGELDRTDPASIDPTDLYVILDAFWEEADRRQFCRPVAIHTPSLLFHPTCVRVCILQQSIMGCATSEEVLSALLVRALDRLQRLSEGRIYVLSTLATSIRKAALTCPELIGVLHLDEYILRFLNNPPTIKSEFLFEVAAADKLQIHQPHRTYASYYGSREWHAYAALIDLLQRIPQEQANVAKSVFDRLLEPWSQQKPGAPIISKWKNVLQLQAMLLLVDFCVPEAEADKYLAHFRHALTLEAWPRYRFLLEWIIARIYYQFPAKSSRILEDLSKLDENSSTHIASLMKMAVLVAPRESEDFSVTFMTQLVPFSASPKVQIRHESNYAVPIIFDLALSKGWRRITENSAFVSLDAFIRSLDKFQSTPWTIRTLKLDAVKDFTLVNVFQGQYLTIESPEKARVAYEDFIALQVADRESGLTIPPGRIPLGEPLTTLPTIDKLQSLKPVIQTIASSAPTTAPAFFQTKSGFDLASLYPPSGPPSLQNLRPASVILVASLIDNPTNLGGLSRISESFGLEALYIADLKATVHKDFKATSVTSEKHLPIRELKVPSVPDFLLDVKREGYEVVGIEQTDQSGILGTEEVVNTNTLQLGTLPRKCVLVLGSEKGGISAEVLAAVDRCVEIRTVGVTRSLNVQTAGGIAVYEWWRKWYEKA